jgi:hypothetical protein
MGKWLTIDKEFPENGCFILFVIKDKMMFGKCKHLKRGIKYVDLSSKKAYGHVDFWQNLPALPKPKKLKIKKV